MNGHTTPTSQCQSEVACRVLDSGKEVGGGMGPVTLDPSRVKATSMYF